MVNNKTEGTVAGLWRFPVKSMGGEQLEEAVVTEHGILGDRAFALIEKETGKVVSAKSVKLYPNLFNCSAAFVEPPREGAQLPPVRISLPDGKTLISDSADVDRDLSEHFGRRVTLGQTAPNDFTIDQYQPDMESTDAAGHQGRVVARKVGAARFAELGTVSPVPPGLFFDGFPLSVLTTSTLEQLERLQPRTRFDQRRFRMNVVIKTARTGFIENGWIGHELGIGHQVRLKVTLPDSRCVMTTLAQGDLPHDTDVLRALVRHNKIQVGDSGQFPCAGVYAVVVAPGTVRTGSPVVLD